MLQDLGNGDKWVKELRDMQDFKEGQTFPDVSDDRYGSNTDGHNDMLGPCHNWDGFTKFGVVREITFEGCHMFSATTVNYPRVRGTFTKVIMIDESTL